MSVATTTIAVVAPQVDEVRSPEDAAEVRALLHDHLEWIVLAAGVDLRRAQPTFVEELAHAGPPAGQPTARFLARLGGAAVGTVSVAFGHDGTAELKRMFVRPVARGTGVADALLEAALGRAEAAGCRSVWLETLRGPMDRAIAVYRRHGFVESSRDETLEDIADVVVMERPLSPSAVEPPA